MIEDISIDINEVSIPDIKVYQPPRWTTNPSSIFAAPPVTQEVGVPVVDMPGCVEAHEQNTSKEKSGILSEDDPKGVKVYCDAGVPSFNPLDYNKDELEFKYEAPVPPVNPPPDAPEVKPPEIPKKTNAAEVKCPTEAQELKEPAGTLVENGTKKIVEYRLVGKECIPVKEDIRIPDQIIQAIPTAGNYHNYRWYCSCRDNICSISKTVGRLSAQGSQTNDQERLLKRLLLSGGSP